MKRPKDAPDTRTPLERMRDFTRKLISVPKEEIAERERDYQDQRKQPKTRKA